MHNITKILFRDISGKFLFAYDEGPVDQYTPLVERGSVFVRDGVQYIVEKEALAENTQHVNVRAVIEDENIIEPHL